MERVQRSVVMIGGDNKSDAKDHLRQLRDSDELDGLFEDGTGLGDTDGDVKSIIHVLSMDREWEVEGEVLFERLPPEGRQVWVL
jgi:hypothetical protein